MKNVDDIHGQNKNPKELPNRHKEGAGNSWENSVEEILEPHT